MEVCFVTVGRVKLHMPARVSWETLFVSLAGSPIWGMHLATSIGSNVARYCFL